MKLTSALKPHLIKKMVIQATAVGAVGAMLILIGGTLIPLHLLKIWGSPIFFVGMGLIIMGLLPYKRLTKLELSPYEICLNPETFLVKKSAISFFELRYDSIDTLTYLEKGSLYGIGIKLKRPTKNRVKVLMPERAFASFATRFLPKFQNIDLFLPYFTSHSYNELKELVHPL